MSRVATNAFYADVVRQFLDSGNKPTWDNIQNHQVQTPYEQEDWQAILDSEQFLEIWKEAGNPHIEGYPTTPIKRLGREYANQLVAIQAKTIGISQRSPDPLTVKYQCGENHDVYPDKTGMPPETCPICKDDQITPDFSQATDMQVYLFQENNLTLSGIVRDESLIYAVKPGQQAYAFGMLKFEPWFNKSTRKAEFRKRLELAHIKPTTITDVTITPEDKIRFEEIVKQDGFYQTLLESFAPHLYGMEEQKEVALMTLASQGISRPFNTLIAGPPARGKTELIKYVIALSQNGHYTAITNATLAGLTSAVENDPETQTRVTKPGLFAMADGGIVGITELQAIRTKEELKISLNDALESKEIASSKADGAVRLQARCAVLMDSNNHKGSWEYLDPLWKNLKYMEPNLGAFLSRLDLISITANETDREVFKQIAKRNFDSYKDKGSVLEYHKEDWDNHYGFITLQKYFAYVTSQPLPPMDEELQEQYADNYVNALEQSPEYAVDGRYNRTIALLARVRARLLLKEKADGQDMNEAIRMVNKSKEIETLQPDGTRDSNASRGLPTKATIERKENQQEQFSEAFERATKSWEEKDGTTKRYAKHDELVYELITRYRWTEHKAEEFIGNMLYRGKIMEEHGQMKYSKA